MNNTQQFLFVDDEKNHMLITGTNYKTFKKVYNNLHEDLDGECCGFYEQLEKKLNCHIKFTSF